MSNAFRLVAPGFEPPGGQGLAEGTVSWRVPAAPLHRGTNVITITCVDANGTARVGTVVKEWQFPGKPGRDR